MSENVTSAVLLSATTAVPVFTGLLPSFPEVRRSIGDPGTVNDVRLGEVAASGTVIAVGLIASSLVKSPVPAMVAVVAALGMVVMYESALRSYPTERKTHNVNT